MKVELKIIEKLIYYDGLRTYSAEDVLTGNKFLIYHKDEDDYFAVKLLDTVILDYLVDETDQFESLKRGFIDIRSWIKERPVFDYNPETNIMTPTTFEKLDQEEVIPKSGVYLP